MVSNSDIIFSTIILYLKFFNIVNANDLAILNVTSKGTVGGQAIIQCMYKPLEAQMTWSHNDITIGSDYRKNITYKVVEETDIPYKVSTLSIERASRDLEGNYTCNIYLDDNIIQNVTQLELTEPARLVTKTSTPVRVRAGENVSLTCTYKGIGLKQLLWKKYDDMHKVFNNTVTHTVHLNDTQLSGTLNLTHLTRNDNGTYLCGVYDPGLRDKVIESIDLLVLDKPLVQWELIKGIGAKKIFLNWTVTDGNSPVTSYILQSNKNGETAWIYLNAKIDPDKTSYIFDDLEPRTSYQFKLQAVNSIGNGQANMYPGWVSTLAADPQFVPTVSIKGCTQSTVTVGWDPPPDNITEYIHYYEVEAQESNEKGTSRKEAIHSGADRNSPYNFGGLKPATFYVFRVRACSEYINECGNWSSSVNVSTLDAPSGPPTSVNVSCEYDQSISLVRVHVVWTAPLKPNGEIQKYTIQLTGNATYVNDEGIIKSETYGPLNITAKKTQRATRFDGLPPNTLYHVNVSATTRIKRDGESVSASCRAPPALPATHMINAHWTKISDVDGRFLFKLKMHRVTERNGPICCYRVVMIRLASGGHLGTLPRLSELHLTNYTYAHMSQVGGAYVAEMFSNDYFPQHSELILGDGVSYNSDNNVLMSKCHTCLKKLPQQQPIYQREPPRDLPPLVRRIPGLPPALNENMLLTMRADSASDRPIIGLNRLEIRDSLKKTEEMMSDERYSSENLDVYMKDRFPRQVADNFDDVMKGGVEQRSERKVPETLYRNEELYDGPLDPNSNYTAVVQLIVEENGDQRTGASVSSGYLNMMHPGPDITRTHNDHIELILEVICACLFVILVVTICAFTLHTRRRKARQLGIEMNSLTDTLRSLYRGIKSRGHDTLRLPVNIPPIPMDLLPAAYLARSADSDLGFQREFEMLPDSFSDRTTSASESRENQPKNRYPDIKAYDQTRVKLSNANGVAGHDYINANYVLGYKEQRKYICAQGPTDTTVEDFWRMLWEQDVELIVMLTNLEEYSKVKCTKYWPDQNEAPRRFGSLLVAHQSEKRYADYIIRELRVCKCADVESNGGTVDGESVVKTNGVNNEERVMKQYHYLTWKDFVAPDYPYAVIHFIKCVRASWTVGQCVVHCSAGVGRTGTLVALDYLLEQMSDTQQVSIYNTIAELRRQRNYLVQSLKQYIFIYKALVEYSYYGDTEITAGKLKSTIDRLRNTPEGADKCLMEIEFEKILNPPLPEPVKSCSAGSSEENRCKNRAEVALPYDRNRVILSPIAGRDYSNYINASFIQGYDNSENFIITQDPLPNTIGDFWRMISEQEIDVIIMLSELGEGKCPRYWDDGTVEHDHITVEYTRSESCPYYTKREFIVTDTKTGCSVSCRQYQYHGWPTVRDGVPEVCRGVCGVMGETQGVRCVAHCQYGERAPLLAALASMRDRLHVQRSVDVPSTVRRLRDQRQNSLHSFVQYEFLHRAILNYAELNNILDDG